MEKHMGNDMGTAIYSGWAKRIARRTPLELTSATSRISNRTVLPPAIRLGYRRVPTASCNVKSCGREWLLYISHKKLVTDISLEDLAASQRDTAATFQKASA